ncbi:MAG: hypothetical protein MMC33_004144 [Icmadophila ericetorum]|nr:hypothetical protein [Icmadophila ericetorum]
MSKRLTLAALLSMPSLFPTSTQAQLMNFDAREATIDSVHHDLYSGLTSCRNIVSTFISRIEAFNSQINAITTLNPTALVTADMLDESLAAGNATGALFCIPILLKDNYDTFDMPTTGGCLDLAYSQPKIDAPVVTALRRAGAIILGKVNLHELALEGLSVSSLGGQVINPYDSSRTPGGSSGGSAAAVAASFAVFATGTDTVNSLRNPASANSLFSVRPTRGLVSRAGIVPVSYTQDAVGPIGRTVRDVAIALTVMASASGGGGFDEGDNVTALVPAGKRGIDYAAALSSRISTTATEELPLNGVRLGLPQVMFNRSSTLETTPVNDLFASLVPKLEAAGATIIPITDPMYNSTTISTALDVQRFEFRQSMDAYLQSRTLGGTHPSTLNELYASKDFLIIPAQYSYVNTALVSSTDNNTYATVLAGIENLKLHLAETFTSQRLDALIYPEQANLVVPLGSPSQVGRNGILAAITGSPVVTVPVGFSPATASASRGVPVGMEILGAWWSEEMLLRIGNAVEMTLKARRMPGWAEEMVEVRAYDGVPIIRPDGGNIDVEAYPVGVL